MIIWSGGGADYAKSWADKLGLTADEYLAKGKLLEDWWIDIPALVRNEKEKRGYKTQKPGKLLDRLVSALSNPGDLVCDPMFGSGTTCLSAMSLGRRFVGCDKSPEAIMTLMNAIEATETRGRQKQ